MHNLYVLDLSSQELELQANNNNNKININEQLLSNNKKNLYRMKKLNKISFINLQLPKKSWTVKTEEEEQQKGKGFWQKLKTI